MYVTAVAGKYQKEALARLYHDFLPAKDDFAALKIIVQIVDRGSIALRCMIGYPFAFFVLPAIVSVRAMAASARERG
jgi:hypothetical protein